MTSLRFSILVAMSLPAFIGAAGAQPATDIWTPKVSFSADATVAHSGQPTLTIRIHFAGDRERMERIAGGRRSIVIMRRDRGVVWRLIPEQKKYIASAAKNPQGLGRKPDGKVTVTRIGDDEVDGVKTTKYKVTATGGTTEYDGHAWVTEHNIQVRYDGQVKSRGRTDSLKINLANVKVGRQPPSLFEIPEGYTDYWSR